MRAYPVSDTDHLNPIVMDQTTLLYGSIQEEVCGEIESTLGSLSDQPQLLKSCLTTRMKYLAFFEGPLYGGPKAPLETQHSLLLPDPISVFAGYLDLRIYKLPVLLHESQVFFFYDFSIANWVFRTAQDCPLKLKYLPQSSTLILENHGLEAPITPWHILQMRSLRLMRR